jgi:O-antigen/teichoic acid export membrane protein
MQTSAPTVQTTSIASSDRRLAASIGKNTLFGVIANGVQIATRLFTVPVVIHHLGLDGYGIWSIIMVTAGYMRFGTAGVKSAFQKYVAEATVTGDYKRVNQLLSTGGISMLLLSITGLIPIAIFAKTLATLSGVPPHFLLAAAASISALAFAYAMSNFGAVYEAIVMGGHRVDLARKYNAVMTLLEAIAIILLLKLGFGLLAMTVVMATSELIYLFLCFRASRWILPEIRISTKYFEKKTFPELARFAGSYQLVSIFEVMYGAILPIAILKSFGAEAAGVVAVATRLVGAALIVQDATFVPILTGAAAVFASQSVDRMKVFLQKSLKMTLATALPPLAVVCVFGATVVMAWTGESRPEFSVAIGLTALAGLLRAIARLQLVVYRASGKALMDNVREILRIGSVIAIAIFSTKLGFSGVLAGMAFAELAGVVFMCFAMSTTLRTINVKVIAGDALRVAAVTGVLIVAGSLPVILTPRAHFDSRMAATIRLGEIALASLIVIWPAVVFTNALSSSERQTLLETVWRRKKSPANQ